MGELTEARARKWLDEMLESTGLSPVRNVTLRSFCDEWLADKRLTVSHAAARRYRRALELLLQGVGLRADKPLSCITASDIPAYRDARLGENVASGTLAHYIKAVRSMFNSARRQGLILTNPAEAIDLPRKRMHERRVFSVQKIRALLSVATAQWATLILLGFYTGARLMDLARLGWDAVDLAGGLITLAQGKTGAKVTIPIHPALAEHLLSIADDHGGPLCPALSVTPATGRDGLSKQFIRLMRAAGIDPEVVQTSKNAFSTKSFHGLRHSFASALANSGVSADLRMKLTGHKSAEIHGTYTHLELQFWLLSHYVYTTHPFPDARRVIRRLREYIPDYNKSSLPTQELMNRIKSAVQNTRKCAKHHNTTNGDGNPSSDVHLLAISLNGSSPAAFRRL